MKVAIVLPNSLELAPYTNYYTDILDSLNINYEYIYWSRNKTYKKSTKKSFVFNKISPEKINYLNKLFDYYLFIRFVKKQLSKGGYDLVIVHTIVCTIYLEAYLTKYFAKRYIFDIRDYSPIVPFVKRKLLRLISNSAMNCISSIGYKKWLPKNFNYILSHNIRSSLLRFEYTDKCDIKSNKISVLTIGQLRDASSNLRIIKDFGNKNNLLLHFAGNGSASSKLEIFAKNNYKNIIFSGRYNKEDEPNIVKQADFINILLPSRIFDIYFRKNRLYSPMSNRFYLSLLHRKPMIVNSESIQAEYVIKHNLGLVIKTNENIYQRLIEYINSFDSLLFNKGREEMLNIVKNDICYFENQVIELLNKKIN